MHGSTDGYASNLTNDPSRLAHFPGQSSDSRPYRGWEIAAGYHHQAALQAIWRTPGRRAKANRVIQKAFRRIGERDGFRCRSCDAGRTLTVDHIIPVTRGGDDEDENLQILCRSCNSSKGVS